MAARALWIIQVHAGFVCVSLSVIIFFFFALNGLFTRGHSQECQTKTLKNRHLLVLLLHPGHHLEEEEHSDQYG